MNPSFKVALHKTYAHPLPDGHRFPMLKYELLPEQLIHEGTLKPEAFFEPQLITEAEILGTHDQDYWTKLKSLSLSRVEERRTGFPLSNELIERERFIMQGTIDCALFALENRISMNIAGGTHHSFTNRGEGFCLLNDIALAANHLTRNGLSKQVLVVDLDVHQGNGTAEIFRHRPDVFTLSMHGAKNYPMHKEVSDLDIEVPDGIQDEAYLKLLDFNLKQTIDQIQPDFIFFQCGVDVLSTDKLGRLGLSLEGCKQRDLLVMKACYDNEIPLAAAMGGGYSEDIRQIIEAHANTFRLAQELYF
ncbi:MAG: acetoin utilization deacetylase AcuC-like enzyme [Flavobacteriales bacterium]|jgi:acetoin utilization deacetylase AcuC-like enzyme